MALVLNTNSYVTVAEADTYFETRIDAANWVSATDEVKESALVTATALIDENRWIGYAVSSSQVLAWPRSDASYYDPKLGRAITVAEDEVPSRVKIAVYEQALHLVDNEDVLTGKTQTFESISVGSISLSDSNNDVKVTPFRSPLVMKNITCLLVNGGNNSWWRSG